MTRLASILWGLIALLLICLACSWAIQRRSVAQVVAAEQQATVAQVERDAAITQNKAKDAEIAIHVQTIEALKADVSRAKAVAAKLRARPSGDVAVHGDTVPSAGLDESGRSGLVASLDAVIASQDELIAEQDNQIKDQAIRIKTGDDALAASMRQTRALEIALKAQKSATTSSKWLGRIQGFAIGVSVGWVGGKLK